jgi:hypothetical protein
MSLIDINQVEKDALAEIAAERSKKATSALVKKLREIDAAESVVNGLKLQLADIKSQIADGTL